jgi:pimeloyl-ACP methyl ester carboxylesterase
VGHLLRYLLLLALLDALPGLRGAAAVSAPATPPAFTIETGAIDGALYTALIPRSWNRRLLLLAHGLREAEMPLVADLNPDHLAYRTLVEEGWIVAKSSYRRNGVIVADAIADLDALRARLAAAHGDPSRVLVEGDSMGGLIALLLAEREPDIVSGSARQVDGVVAVDPAPTVRENNRTVSLSLHPGVPVVFLANQSELAASQAYAANARPTTADRQPVFLRVSRDGHVNVNQPERLTALRLLNRWLDSGRDALPRPARGEAAVDVTLDAGRLPTQVTMHADGRGFDARVLQVTERFGNIYLNVQPDDFLAAGIKSLNWFEVKIGTQAWRTRYGNYFDNVATGEWVAFGSADGFTWLGRNNANAAQTAGVKAGDTITFRAYEAAR